MTEESFNDLFAANFADVWRFARRRTASGVEADWTPSCSGEIRDPPDTYRSNPTEKGVTAMTGPDEFPPDPTLRDAPPAPGSPRYQAILERAMTTTSTPFRYARSPRPATRADGRAGPPRPPESRQC